ncbi:MAG: ribose-phosphate pyrophosphokinase [Planctomycetes bacterium]|nr:ribose-phosphate pyrophosphokinase [Planctomycetota bacterium]
MRIYIGNAHPELGKAVCAHLRQEPGMIDVQQFPDSETKVRIRDNVRGVNAFIIQPTCAPVNENLMELLIMVDAMRRASVKSITAVIPYFGYARQDRKHEGRVPITAKLVTNLIAASGATRVLTVDLHAHQIQGFFDLPLDHLYAAPVLVKYLKSLHLEKPVVVSPDAGSVKMAARYARHLDTSFAIIEKKRLSDEVVETGHVVGDVQDCDAIIVDDMIASAGSMAAAVETARAHGARSVRILATHGLFVSRAYERLVEAKPTEVIITDTVPLVEPVPPELNLKVISLATLIGDAISHIHRNKSVSSLFG